VTSFLDAGVPAGPINDFGAALASDHAQARNMVQEIDHPVEGRIKALGFPVKLSETPQQVRLHPPLLGEHTQSIVDELGLGGEAAALERDGAFAP
jgi:formyl-CoA transferase